MGRKISQVSHNDCLTSESYQRENYDQTQRLTKNSEMSGELRDWRY